MPKAIKNLVGTRILGIQWIYDYWQIITDTCGINVYNPVKYYMSTNQYHELSEIKIGDIIGHTITEEENKKSCYMRFKLDTGATIEISLADKDYNGPEAVNINFDSGEIYVD